MRKTLILFVLLAMTATVGAVPRQISDNARVSFLTCGPGGEVYSKFGHTGIRIEDEASGADVVFHWGIFSFETPNFALRFMLGETDYEMGPFDTDVFVSEYERRGSYIIEQELDLTPEQKQRLWNKLWSDFLSERHRYRYSFVGNNCATKAYDEIVALYRQNIIFDYEHRNTTYRHLINKYVERNSWFNLGINIIIGSQADVPIGTQQSLTFPEYTKTALNNCYYRTPDGTIRPVVMEQHAILHQTTEYAASWIWYLLQLLIPVALIAAQSLYYYKHHHYIPVLTQAIYLVCGTLSLLILFLWHISSHPLVDDNYNILFLSPLMIPLGIVLFVRGHRRLKLITALVTWMSVTAYIIPIIWDLQGITLALAVWWLMVYCTATLTVATYRHELKKLFSKLFLRFHSKRAVLTILALLVLCIAQAETPRIVVAIMIDGLNTNELEAYSRVLSDKGLMYLTNQGAYTNSAQCRYMASDACTHYASLFTGSTPRYHGIVSERFYSMIDDDIVSCIDDARHSGINTPLSVSPRLLQSTTVADQIKLTYSDSKVYSIGLRAESSVIMGGHLADGAVWIDDATGMLATSTFYNNGMPRWAEKFNSDSSIYKLCQKAWYAQKPLYQYWYPAAKTYYGEEIPAFQKFSGNDPMPERIDNLRHTPMVNDLIKELAVRALRDEQLGTDNAPDMLCVEFSARIPAETTMLCAEKEDMLMRLDENIERLIEAIEISVGLDNSIILFAAPSTYRQANVIDTDKINHGTFKAERSMALLNAYLMAIYGQGRWVTGYYNQNIHLNKRLIEDNQIRMNEICDHTAQFITEFSGVHSAVPAYLIQMAAGLPSDLPSRMRNSHYKNRSGDVVFTLLPGWTETTPDGKTLTSTLSATAIPIAIIAPGFRQRKINGIQVEDICPTLCNLLNIPMTNACTGQTINPE